MEDVIFIKFTKSAFKHGVEKQDIILALSNPLFEGMLEDFPEKYLVIGFSKSGNLLEVIYNLENDKEVKIFHAMKCRKNYIELLDF